MACLTPAEQIEQAYDLAMVALADYLTRERDAAATIDRLIRVLDRDELRDAITEVLVDARVHPRPRSDAPKVDQ
ncbi:tRNA isopentenyl-2-thiomethyl-A-37 hydroxylase MiaE [Bradyrhizobium sp. F1.13.1]